MVSPVFMSDRCGFSAPCIDAKEGDKVRVAECRPLSKTVAFVIIEKEE